MEWAIAVFEDESKTVAVASAVAKRLREAATEDINQVQHVTVADAVVAGDVKSRMLTAELADFGPDYGIVTRTLRHVHRHRRLLPRFEVAPWLNRHRRLRGLGPFDALALRQVGVHVNGPARRVHDLDLWLDKLALAQSVAGAETSAASFVAKQNVITFAPDGARGVAAYIDGQKAASV